MGNSLQDQLKKSRGSPTRSRPRRRSARRGRRQRDAQRGKVVEDEATRLAREAQEAKVARDRELNRAAQDVRRAREIQAQIREIVELNRIAERGQAEFRFTDETRIRTLHVEETARKALVRGRLGVVRLDGAGARRRAALRAGAAPGGREDRRAGRGARRAAELARERTSTRRRPRTIRTRATRCRTI